MKSALFSLLIILVVNVQLSASEYRFNRIDITNGLSNNNVRSIFKDRDGFMWIGTTHGLNRYDGNSFKVFTHNYQDQYSIADNFINAINQDPAGTLWIDTRKGFCLFSPLYETFESNTDIFFESYGMKPLEVSTVFNAKNGGFLIVSSNNRIIRYLIYQDEITLVDITPEKIFDKYQGLNAISSVHDDMDGMLWVIMTDGYIFRFDPDSRQVLNFTTELSQLYGSQRNSYKLFIDNANSLWIYLTTQAFGLYHYIPYEKKLIHYHTGSESGRLNNNTITGMIQDASGKMWIATDHGGINIMRTENNAVHYIQHQQYSRFSIPDNAISCLYLDSDGIKWVGTYKSGLAYYHENMVRFPVMASYPGFHSESRYNDINCFEQDQQGNLWIGTNGAGLLYYDVRNNSYKSFRHEPGNPSSLGSDVVVSLKFDHYGVLWVGTYHGGLNRYEGDGVFKKYRHDPAVSGSISDDKIWSLFEDSNKKLWIGTLAGGLDTLDRAGNRFINMNKNEAFQVYSDAINSITEDFEGYLWLGTADGLTRLNDRQQVSTHFYPEANQSGSLGHDLVNTVYVDSRGLLWIGTMEGLNIYNQVENNFMIITRHDGLSDNTIRGIVEDESGNMWISTGHGITQIIVQTSDAPSMWPLSFNFFTYDETDGLQGRDFNVNAAFKTREGRLLFGGSNGWHMFCPAQIKRNASPPDIVFTGLQVLNQPVRPGKADGNRQILRKSLANTDIVELRYQENIFSIEFAALNLINPGKNRYAYKLQGFNKDWVYPDHIEPRRATYTNLDPGTYVFMVKASNNDGIWNEEGISLTIKVLPPFWRSGYAIALYVVFLGFLLLLARYIVLQKERYNNSIALQKKEAQRQHELDLVKIRFFTNISHELRTPLSLIISPIEQTLKASHDRETRNLLETVHKNARRLMSRVNQLLDFRRMESEEIKLHPQKTEIIAFIKDTTLSFTDFADTKNIRLTFETSIDELFTCVDRDKLEKIMFNLLSNAFKFTPVNGNIKVIVDLESQSHKKDILANDLPVHDKQPRLTITVADNGIGIPENKLNKIFDHFFQDEGSGTIINQGSGIGLALTKEYVRLHGGEITVISIPEKGSSFCVFFPLQSADGHIIRDTADENLICQGNRVPAFQNETEAISDPAKPLILLIEDNDDFRFYLKDNLRKSYNIIEAADGRAGLTLVRRRIPDIVITDLRMPGIDGYEICRQIKGTDRTAHIPVIILTAQALSDQQLEGYESGAEDYLVKPFSLELLEARIRNLLRNQDQVRQDWKTMVDKQSGKLKVKPLDEKFISKAISHIEAHLSDPGFTVEDLSKQMCISRVHLYKKLMAISGMPPIDFIRYMRMRRAATLLKESQLNVSEVCYQVGYNDPKHFTMHFKKEFNMTPSGFKKQFLKENKNVNL